MRERSFRYAIALGVVVGIALILTVSLFTRGQLILIPYALLFVFAAAYLRSRGVGPFSRRIALILLAFMVATLLLYGYIGLWQARTLLAISVMGHAWRLALMAAIGGIASTIVAAIPVRREAV